MIKQRIVRVECAGEDEGREKSGEIVQERGRVRNKINWKKSTD